MIEVDKGKFDTNTMSEEIVFEGKIDKLVETFKELLIGLSNRDYERFNEKNEKMIFYSICKMLGGVFVKSELEISGKYSDILIVPREKKEERYVVLIEFKYIKKQDYESNPQLLEQRKQEAKEQIENYRNTEEIKLFPNVKAYIIIGIKDEIIVEEV